MKSDTLLVLAVMALSSCGDPTTQTPVSVERGLYQSEISGTFAGLINTADMFPDGSERSKSFCYRGLTDGYPTQAIEALMNMENRCGRPGLDRRGNELVLKLSCPMDRAKGIGQINFTYTGVISETSLDGNIKADFDIQVSNDPEFDRYRSEIEMMTKLYKVQVKTTRVGDC